MNSELRKSGIFRRTELSWGKHFCQFYRTSEDLADILIPYFKAGLKNNKFCMWITSDVLDENEAKNLMKRAVPNFDQFIKRKQIEIIPHTDWYLKSGVFNPKEVLNCWNDKLDQALAEGFDGMRVSGDTSWLEKKDWKKFIVYEEELNKTIGERQMLAVCTYCLDKCGASRVIDVINNHQFALIKHEGEWKITENRGSRYRNEALKNREISKKLNRYLQSKREKEKKHIANCIIGDVAQDLVALKMGLYRLDIDLPEGLDDMSADIQKMSELVDKTVHRAKEIYTELRPSVLNHLGIVAATEWLVGDFENRTGIKCELKIGSEHIDLNWDRSTAIFRILQELLKNVEQHANATRVNIELNAKNENLVLDVKDNGIGIIKNQVADPNSLGIIEIKERVDSLGGECTFKGVSNKGTTVKINCAVY